MADTNLVAMALARGFLSRPSRETGIARLLATEDEKDEGNWGQLPPLSELGSAFLRSLDRRFVQPAINGLLAPSRALQGHYSGIYLYPDGVLRPYSPQMYDDASAMAGLVGLGGVVPKGQLTANPLTSLASRSARIYDPPSVPQRPFEADYPFGAQVDEAGRVTRDIDGNPLQAQHIVGRNLASGPEVALAPEALDEIATALTGAPIRRVAPGSPELGPDVGRAFFGRSGQPDSVYISRGLSGAEAPRVAAHEIGHVIDGIAQIPAEGLNRELRSIYNDLNNPQSYGRPFGPEQLGYSPSEVRQELMAEALRAYLADPNYIKATAPEVAARIRQHVNQNPQLRSVVQFNAGGVPLPAQPGRPDSEWIPGYFPETGEWRM